MILTNMWATINVTLALHIIYLVALKVPFITMFHIVAIIKLPIVIVLTIKIVSRGDLVVNVFLNLIDI